MKAQDLERIYNRRFQGKDDYRNRVWKALVESFFQRYIPATATILDLGCGYGQFINHIQAGRKYAMDLNPATRGLLREDIGFLEADCSQHWPVDDASLDVVFTSNFFEHLLSKDALTGTVRQAFRCLRPGGKLIAIGPNIKYLAGAYWDFFDHNVPLTEMSLSELLEVEGFRIDECVPRFLPYNMVNVREYPAIFVRLYVHLPLAWPLFGKQFLVVASKR